jgi:hypothetical protein
MRKERFSAYMKILFLALLFMCLEHGASAPTKGYPLRKSIWNYAREFAESRHHESEYKRFITDLGFRESGNNWLSVNCIGCFGEWQFAESTVHYLGFKYVTLKKFKTNPEVFPPELQAKALESLIKVNRVLLRKYEQYVGDTIMGVVITKSGMIAASHLGGAQSVRLFLASDGRIDKADVLGTSVRDYMKRFSFYDID